MEILQWQRRILNVRGHRVILDIHLAEMLAMDIEQVRLEAQAYGDPDHEVQVFRLKKLEWRQIRKNCFSGEAGMVASELVQDLPHCITLSGMKAILESSPSQRAMDLLQIWEATLEPASQVSMNLGEENWRLAQLEAETGLDWEDTWQVYDHWWEERRDRKAPRGIGPKWKKTSPQVSAGIEVEFE